MSVLSLVSVPARRHGSTRVAVLGVALAVSMAALAGCGSTPTKTPSTSSSKASTTSAASKTSTASKTSGSSSGASPTSSTSSSSIPPAAYTTAQLIKYYTPKGAPVTLTSGQAQSIAVNDFYFDPNTLTASPGARVVLNLKNASALEHTFTLPVAKVNVSIQSGGSATVRFTAPSKPGTYYFYCSVPSHAALGMVGKLTVK